MVLHSLKEYLDVTPADEARLRALLPVVRPALPRCSQAFHDRLLAHHKARVALERAGEASRLEVTFSAWMEELLTGPLDDRYYQRRSRMGRAHARIGLAQQYVVMAMSVVRRELEALAERSGGVESRISIDKALDLDLAIMAHAHRKAELLAQAQGERQSTLGQLVGTMGHELRSPLAVMESSLFILQGRSSDDAGIQKHLGRIGQQIGLTGRKISGMLELIREHPLHRVRVSPSEIVDAALRRAAIPAQIPVRREGLSTTPDLVGDVEELTALLEALLENALDAIDLGEGGEIRIDARRGPDHDVELAISDSGRGVESWLLPRLFEPLVSTRPDRLGLGLARVRRIAEQHGGDADYEPGPPHRFVVRLPQA